MTALSKRTFRHMVGVTLILFVGTASCAQSVFVNGQTTTPPTSDVQTSIVTSTEMPSDEYISAVGQDLTYQGHIIYLKGANFNNQPAIKVRTETETYGSGDINEINYSEADYMRLSDMGGNHVRWGISFNWYKDDRAKFFSVLDQHIDWARKYNLWLVLVLYTFPDDCYEGYRYQCPFWNDTNLWQDLRAFWVDVADYYKDEPVIAGFDLINEPTPDDTEKWFSIAQVIYDSVHAIDPNRLVFVELDPGGKKFELLDGENIVYSIHIYAPLALTHADAQTNLEYPGLFPENGIPVWWDKSAMSETGIYLSDIRDRYLINWLEQNNKPVYIGEFGSRAWVDGYLQYVEDLYDLFDKWGVHYAFFVWRAHSFEDFGIYPMEGALIPWDDKREALIASMLAGSFRPSFDD